MAGTPSPPHPRPLTPDPTPPFRGRGEDFVFLGCCGKRAWLPSPVECVRLLPLSGLLTFRRGFVKNRSESLDFREGIQRKAFDFS